MRHLTSNNGRAFHGEELHAQRGLEVAQLQLDVPAPCVEVGGCQIRMGCLVAGQQEAAPP